MFANLTVEQLRDECIRRQLDAHGARAVLLRRLRVAIDDNQEILVPDELENNLEPINEPRVPDVPLAQRGIPLPPPLPEAHSQPEVRIPARAMNENYLLRRELEILRRELDLARAEGELHR